ncbi:MAG: division/cell wall cluster transcriptional repressor MraZ [Eubacteriales bacterium]|nr:division/cell wall cluster transcriptional repressor MraZ [Eubacteriales bacterium]
MYTGEYNHTIDEKGRLIIPTKFRELLGNSFVVTKSLDGCLSIYDSIKWDELEKKLNQLPMTNKSARELKRFLLGGANIVELDKQGRILITQPLRKSAKLLGDISLVGVGDHIEIWNTEEWNKISNYGDFENIAQSMEGLGI